MKKAKDAGVPVVLHTESTTPKQCKELSEMGRKAGLYSNKIIKHYSPPLILESENFGLMPSVLARKKNIFTAIQKGTRFMLETDYIDDPNRPGAVLGPKTVPRLTKEMIEKDLVSEEEFIKVHKENPEKTYSICLDQ
jgi:TatD-related deoxyribonuclease